MTKMSVDELEQGLSKIDLVFKFQYDSEKRVNEVFDEYLLFNKVDGFSLEKDGNKLYMKISIDEDKCRSPFDALDKIFDNIDNLDSKE